MNQVKLEKILSLKDKSYNQVSELGLGKNKTIITKKPYVVPQINQLPVSSIITSGSSVSDFDAFNTSS